MLPMTRRTNPAPSRPPDGTAPSEPVPGGQPEGPRSWGDAPLLQPVPLASLTILLAVVLLIAATVLGWDKGNVLQNLQNGLYARGLITYLFAVGTIGGVVILILAALTGAGGEHDKENFARAKEILSLLLGIFGTIIGFYFGSIKSEQEGPVGSAGPVQVLIPTFTDTVAGSSIPLTAFIRGGAPPYLYGIGLDEKSASSPERTSVDGWIRDSIPAPVLGVPDTTLTIFITATDRSATVTTSRSTVVLQRGGAPVPTAPGPAAPADSAGG
jgi:uncharacterized membrane protein